MAADQDQSSWLPEPPPPRPARRDAAIEAALRRFDGVEEAAPVASERPRRSWASTHRPQFAMLVSAMLLVVVGIPAALIGLGEQPSTSERAPALPAVRYEPSPAQAPAAQQQVAEAPSVAAKAAPPATGQHGQLQKSQTRDEPAAEAAPPALAVAPPSAAAPVAAAPPPPPPPAAVASNANGTARMADEIVVSGTRVANPALTAAQGFDAMQAKAARSEAKPVNQAYAAFLSRLQGAVRADDRRAVIALIGFPLRVNRNRATRFYRDARSVEKDFDRIFTARVKRTVLRQRADQLFVRDLGAMIGDGEVWFDQTCANASCSPAGPVRIFAVNP